MKNTIKDIIKPYQGEKGSLIPILQAVQEKTGFISEDAVSTIALNLNMPEHEIYGVATFYTQFRYTKPGDHMVKVCLGTACHVRGGEQLLNRTENILNIKPGQTTPDSAFSLERVACMGCCALAPVIVVDNKIYPNVTGPKVKKIISKYSSPDKKE